VNSTYTPSKQLLWWLIHNLSHNLTIIFSLSLARIYMFMCPVHMAFGYKRIYRKYNNIFYWNSVYLQFYRFQTKVERICNYSQSQFLLVTFQIKLETLCFGGRICFRPQVKHPLIWAWRTIFGAEFSNKFICRGPKWLGGSLTLLPEDSSLCLPWNTTLLTLF